MERLLLLWRWPSVSLRGAGRMWLRDLTLYRRAWTMNILPNFFEPLLFLVAIGFGLGLYLRNSVEGVPYGHFIAPGLAAAAAMNGAVFEVTFNVFVKANFARLYDAVITTPLEPEDCAAGELMWAVSRSLIYTVAFVSIMAALGYIRSPAGAVALVALPLVGLALGLVGLIFTSLVPSIDFYTYFFTLFVTPLFLFSGIFFPIEVLPKAVGVLAWFTPLYHGVEMARALTLGGDLGAAGGHALWLVVFSAVLLPPALNLFRRRLIT